jgi:hypothetical protein
MHSNFLSLLVWANNRKDELVNFYLMEPLAHTLLLAFVPSLRAPNSCKIDRRRPSSTVRVSYPPPELTSFSAIYVAWRPH